MLILNFQYWARDRAASMALARLVADLEPQKREDVSVLFSARFDCDHDEESIAYVAKKFKVFKYKSTYRATGWPAGPNWLMANSYQHCIELIRAKRVDAHAVMLIEADCVPLHPRWLDMVMEEYRQCGQMVLGAYVVGADERNKHINGNCIIHKDFWKKYKPILSPSRVAWDADMASAILPNSCPSKLIWSDYQLGMPCNPWRGVDYLFEEKMYELPFHPLYGEKLQPVWFHGIKQKGIIEDVRKRLELVAGK